MLYSEFLKRESFDQIELIASAHGRLVDDPPIGGVPSLPAPPFLMFDRIINVDRGAGRKIIAEQDIRMDAWYFQCHFRDDPVQPGCLGLDAIWQLLGFYCALNGAIGSGRALGCKDVEFQGQIRPHNKIVRYELSVSKVLSLPKSEAVIAISDGLVSVDDEEVYQVKGVRFGVFQNIAYRDYPFLGSKFAHGGTVEVKR